MSADIKKGIGEPANRMTRRGVTAEGITRRQARAPQMEPIDLYIGGRVRAARTMRGMTREQLAPRLGVALQTIERYELGEMRLMASRLFAIADELEMPFNFFVEGFKKGDPPPSVELLRAMSIGNMEILTQLSELTYEQRGTVQRVIDALRGENANKQRAAAASAAGAATGVG